MFLATVNPVKQLLHISFIAEVTAQELSSSEAEIVTLLTDLKPGFRLLSDLERMNSMAEECALYIGQMMELFDQRGLALIVRVIPDPSRDIGLGILSLFHYPRRPRMVACTSMLEAAKLLKL